MLRQDRNHHRGKLSSLGPVHGHREGGLQFVQFREIVFHAGFLEAHRDPPGGVVHSGSPAQIAVEHILVVVVDRLEHTVAHPESASEACYLGSHRVEGLPEPVVESMGTDNPPVHGTQHLNVPHGTQSEPRRDPLCADADDSIGRRLRLFGFDEVEVPMGVAGAQRGQAALVNPVGRLDDAAPVPLTENPLQTEEGYYSGLEDVPKELAGPDGGQLVGISDEQHRGVARNGLQ